VHLANDECATRVEEVLVVRADQAGWEVAWRGVGEDECQHNKRLAKADVVGKDAAVWALRHVHSKLCQKG
jgi:hypothetical protein